MKKCPYCSEEIQEEAIKCRYCGEWLARIDEEVMGKDKQIVKPKYAELFCENCKNYFEYKDAVYKLGSLFFCPNCSDKDLTHTTEPGKLFKNKCNHCGKLVEDKSEYCSFCNGLLNYNNTKRCPECEYDNPRSNNRCIHCGYAFNADARHTRGKDVARRNFQQSETTCSQILQQQSIQCPHCGSPSIHADKKGFGLGKAIAGGIIGGAPGLLAGLIGKNKIYLTCMKCGHRWSP